MNGSNGSKLNEMLDKKLLFVLPSLSFSMTLVFAIRPSKTPCKTVIAA